MPGSDSLRVDYLFRRCLARVPTKGETVRVLQLLDEQRAALRKDPQRAQLLAGDAKQDALDRAAWTFCSRVLLNLDEFITRE